ncbi:MAG: hypothetical protein WA085_16270 [Sphingobium sp.]
MQSTFDPLRRRLHIKYTGFWSPADADAALSDFQQALSGAGAAGRPFTLLDDLREWSPQSPKIVDGNAAFTRIFQQYPISRNAMIIPSALIRRQVARALDNDDAWRTFDTFDEADNWLAEVEKSWPLMS